MKRMLLAACAVLALSASAHARVGLPANLMGNWCMVDPTAVQDGKWTYGRALRCPHGFFLSFRADGLDGKDGTDGPSMKCRLQVIVTNKPDDYVAKFHCRGAGQSWSAVYRLSLQEERLIVTDIHGAAGFEGA